ncbi:MAG: tRNA (5-methylaminomethyl-2-thiouridine)(34)-methyltransferase MnmD [Saprospiraceae bacterium]|nr:tRNA (5-methylaminomethyl-2-thiouridine)(34)-methyltransferase MnmD [Saprospiraceae bacterium]
MITTDDGSHSIFDGDLQETFHSKHGAIQESQHVFISAGLTPCMASKDQVNILELGFGTGLNAALSWKYGQHHPSSMINYSSLEAFPLSSEITRKLNYAQLLGMEDFYRLHTAEWNKPTALSPNFTLHKIKTDFSKFSYVRAYDLIYFDVFAPKYQSRFWEEPFLSNLLANQEPGSVLVTYGAKGSFRRTLQRLGMEVEKLPGPRGKREMTRAIKR